jgi:hypothetical protein
MAQDEAKSTGPDLTQGMPLMQIPFSGIVGHVGDEQVLMAAVGTVGGALTTRARLRGLGSL